MNSEATAWKGQPDTCCDRQMSGWIADNYYNVINWLKEELKAPPQRVLSLAHDKWHSKAEWIILEICNYGFNLNTEFEFWIWIEFTISIPHLLYFVLHT